MQITILHNQSLFDVLLQHTGSLTGIFDVAMVNGLSIAQNLTPGQKLTIPDSVEKDKDILNYYKAKNVQPATAIVVESKEKLEGISVWAIGHDFIVGG